MISIYSFKSINVVFFTNRNLIFYNMFKFKSQFQLAFPIVLMTSVAVYAGITYDKMEAWLNIHQIILVYIMTIIN